jgi:hypothetical protein
MGYLLLGAILLIAQLEGYGSASPLTGRRGRLPARVATFGSPSQ